MQNPKVVQSLFGIEVHVPTPSGGLAPIITETGEPADFTAEARSARFPADQRAIWDRVVAGGRIISR